MRQPPKLILTIGFAFMMVPFVMFQVTLYGLVNLGEELFSPPPTDYMAWLGLVVVAGLGIIQVRRSGFIFFWMSLAAYFAYFVAKLSSHTLTWSLLVMLGLYLAAACVLLQFRYRRLFLDPDLRTWEWVNCVGLGLEAVIQTPNASAGSLRHNVVELSDKGVLLTGWEGALGPTAQIELHYKAKRLEAKIEAVESQSLRSGLLRVTFKKMSWSHRLQLLAWMSQINAAKKSENMNGPNVSLSPNSGVTMVDLMTGLAMGVVVMTALVALSVAAMKQSSFVEIGQTADQLRRNLIQVLSSDTSWARTLLVANNPAMACLNNGQACGAIGPQALRVMDSGDRVVLDSSVATRGFVRNGIPCNTFDNVNGSDSCPLRFEVTWEPTETACPYSDAIVRVTVRYRPRNIRDITFNPVNYAFTMYRPGRSTSESNPNFIAKWECGNRLGASRIHEPPPLAAMLTAPAGTGVMTPVVGIGTSDQNPPNRGLRVIGGGNIANHYTARFTNTGSNTSLAIGATSIGGTEQAAIQAYDTATGTKPLLINALSGGQIGIGPGALAAVFPGNVPPAQALPYDVNMYTDLAATGMTRKPGGGMWVSTSDIRLKHSIRPFEAKASEFVKLNPIEFEFNGLAHTKAGQTEVSVSAQETEKVFPHLVEESPEKLSPSDSEMTSIKTLKVDWLLMTIVAATKDLVKEYQENTTELDTRISGLEKRLQMAQSRRASLEQRLRTRANP